MSEASVGRSLTWKSSLEFVSTILLVLVTLMVGGFAVMDRLRPPPPTRGPGIKPVLTSIPIPVADAPVKGSRSAKIALVLFSDFQCPVCSRAEREVMPQLQAQYIDTGKVLLVWRHDPLRIHPEARGTAEATECAGRQRKFWELHDWAFGHQQDLKSDRMRLAAQNLGLDMLVFDKCTTGEASEKVANDITLAEQLGVDGTPTWFIGTIEPNGMVKPVDRIDGLGPADAYGKAIDRLIQAR